MVSKAFRKAVREGKIDLADLRNMLADGGNSPYLSREPSMKCKLYSLKRIYIEDMYHQQEEGTMQWPELD